MTTNFDSDSPKKKFTLVETDSVIDQDLKGVKSVGKSTSVDRIWSDIVNEWRPQSETFFLRWGSFILPQISILTAYEVARNAFQLNRVSVIGRSKKIGWHSKLTVISWSFGLSLPISFMTNRFLVLEDILLQKSQCSTCNISRGMGLNLLTATILPGVLSGSGANLITARPAGFTMVEGMRKNFNDDGTARLLTSYILDLVSIGLLGLSTLYFRNLLAEGVPKLFVLTYKHTCADCSFFDFIWRSF